MINLGPSRSQFSTTSLKSSPEQSIEYYWIDGVERLEMYEPGGYHPVMIDDLLHNRYRIVDKLGYGGYSTIWLARDETAKRYVTVKIGISSPSTPRREIEVLVWTLARHIHLRNALVRLPTTLEELSVEELRAKFGEPEMIPIARVDGKPLTLNVPAQAVLPLYLGKKADEFTMDDARGLILSDFGEAFSPVTERRLGRNCNIPLVKRAPEAFFEPNKPLSYPSDIWSLGLAIWEILAMRPIFSDCEPLDEIVAEQIDVLGYQSFPQAWKSQWERTGNEEDEKSDMIPRRPADGDRETWHTLEDAFEKYVQKFRRDQEAAGTFDEEETQAILQLMRGMLKFRPEERLTIDEVLGSEWMVNWALPQLAQGSDVPQRRKK
ncbi:hypothetical protein E8E13_003375 [Curvularia kusanoi]|uniref:Protein kinase domain-containing protein n=1 Tax=Curvularia kusanoi TaxID=90978 RepID=A0A9P4T7Y8_CURKU|nr:hypothetical protein E8E13_003375 [Curvularia kusanoi]